MVEVIDIKELGNVWVDFKKSGDFTLRDQLILHYLKLVKYVVGKLAINLPGHIRLDDLYSTGVVGLVKAIDQYDLTKKNKFETYAIILIKGAIIDELRALDWVPRGVHQRANRIREVKEALEQKLQREVRDVEVAKEMGISFTEYQEMSEKAQSPTMVSLNRNYDQDLDRGTLEERIADSKAQSSCDAAHYNELRSLLEKEVSILPEQEKSVLVYYYYDNLMLKEIGQLLGVTESRVSQIHSKALQHLKSRLEYV